MEIFSDPLWPSLCVMISVMLLTYVSVDIVSYISTRYKERYLEEAALELDDVLLNLPPGRVLDVSIALSVLAAFLASGLLMFRVQEIKMSQTVIVAVVAAVVAFPLPRIFLRQLKKRRLAKFNEQLEDALGTMSSALKAGFSIVQAIDEIAGQNRPPISVEFRLLSQEMRLGVPMETALDNMNKRLRSDDFELVSMAIITARQTGGELTSALERLASLIRERMRINNKLKAMTSMGRLQALMIGCMPFLLLFGMMYVAPAMVERFLNSFLGYVCIGVVVVLDMVGYFAIRKITTIDV